MAISVDTLGSDALTKCATTAMSSKIIGSESDFFSKMAVDAMLAVRSSSPDGKVLCGCNPRGFNLFLDGVWNVMHCSCSIGCLNAQENGWACRRDIQ